MQASRNGKPWTREDLERLRQLWKERKSANAIADMLQRTPVGIRSKATALGLKVGTSRRLQRPQVGAHDEGG